MVGCNLYQVYLWHQKTSTATYNAGGSKHRSSSQHGQGIKKHTKQVETKSVSAANHSMYAICVHV